jgi:hypothetical protein
MGFWRASRRRRELEATLRANRPDPRPEFIRAVAATVGDGRGRGLGAFRAALAGGFTALLLIALAAAGGLGYAAAAVDRAATAVAKTVDVSDKRGSQQAKARPTPAQSQYGVPICHRTGSDKNPYVLIVVDENAVDAHRRHPPQNGREDIIPAPATGCPTS